MSFTFKGLSILLFLFWCPFNGILTCKSSPTVFVKTKHCDECFHPNEISGLHAADADAGYPLVLLHEWCSDLSAWTHLTGPSAWIALDCHTKIWSLQRMHIIRSTAWSASPNGQLNHTKSGVQSMLIWAYGRFRKLKCLRRFEVLQVQEIGKTPAPNFKICKEISNWYVNSVGG